uniref:Uncharacterized protein n=1 Tax=Sphaerodactylus townsendi TaxID=933632 RepID=A0ACB8EXV3_9SAUR
MTLHDLNTCLWLGLGAGILTSVHTCKYQTQQYHIYPKGSPPSMEDNPPKEKALHTKIDVLNYCTQWYLPFDFKIPPSNGACGKNTLAFLSGKLDSCLQLLT